MSPIRLHRLTTLHILLCSFIHNIICSNDRNNPYESIHTLSTLSTSFIIPITLQHSEWFISNPNSPTNTLIPLESFLDTLTNYQPNPQNFIIQFQIDTIQTYNNQINSFIIDSFNELYTIIEENNISISRNLIISQDIPIQIMQTIYNENLLITINIHSISTLIQHKRNLLSNETNISNTQYEIIEIESYICKAWPIYLGFFAGIGVTVIITFVMNLTTGEKDAELNDAVAKFITAGIETSGGDGPVEIVAGPTRHRKYRTNSAILIYNNQLSLSPKSHTRSRSYIKRPQNVIQNKKLPSELAWANDLQMPGLKERIKPLNIKGITASIEEEEEDDESDNNNTTDQSNDSIKYDQLNNHRDSLRIFAKNLLNTPNSTITPIQTDITPKSDGDVYLSNSSAHSSDTNGQKTSDEMSISELTSDETNDSPIRIIRHQQFDYSDAIQQQEKQTNIKNKSNLNLAQNIDLSPIVESVVNFDEFKMRQQKQHQPYRITSNDKTYSDGVHRRNVTGQTIRVGLNLKRKNDNNIDIKPYDCLGTSSENSENSVSTDTTSYSVSDTNEETHIDEQQSNETLMDDGMEGDDESDVYSDDENEETMIIDNNYDEEEEEEEGDEVP